LKQYEAAGDFASRLALMEELKVMPSGAVWDYYCHSKGVPVGMAFMEIIRSYEKAELAGRS
jgi:L-rhamnose isomerase